MNNIEYEVKILDIDVDAVKSKLVELWAEYKWRKEFRRYVYWFEWEWSKYMRLRTDWNKSTLTAKQEYSREIWWITEHEILVEDFEKTHTLLSFVWIEYKMYQENTRETYVLWDLEFDIDTWPFIPTFLEIEGKNVDDVKKWMQILWIDESRATILPLEEIYVNYGYPRDILFKLRKDENS